MLSWGKIKAESRSFFQPEIGYNLILLISSQKRGRITPTVFSKPETPPWRRQTSAETEESECQNGQVNGQGRKKCGTDVHVCGLLHCSGIQDWENPTVINSRSYNVVSKGGNLAAHTDRSFLKGIRKNRHLRRTCWLGQCHWGDNPAFEAGEAAEI